MENLNNQNEITNSPLYKRNLKIHRNLWKLYGLTLSFSLIFILVKGLN